MLNISFNYNRPTRSEDQLFNTYQGQINKYAKAIDQDKNPEEIILETASSSLSERGATRLDDQTNEASMERRKKEGYF